MKADLRSLAAASGLLVSLWLSGPAFAQKPGGILRMYHWDSPPSMSIHEEVTIAPGRRNSSIPAPARATGTPRAHLGRS